MNKHILMGITILGTSVLGLNAVSAATATGSLNVKIKIQGECKVTTGTTATLDFGTHGVLDVNKDATGQISVQCTNTTPYSVGLNAGTGAGATITTRKMTGTAAATIDYQLFRDASHTQNWGITAGTDTLAGTGNGAVQNIPVYGRVIPQNTPAPGDYTDTVAVTVTY